MGIDADADGRACALVILTGGIDEHSAAASLIADLSWIVYNAIMES